MEELLPPYKISIVIFLLRIFWFKILRGKKILILVSLNITSIKIFFISKVSQKNARLAVFFWKGWNQTNSQSFFFLWKRELEKKIQREEFFQNRKKFWFFFRSLDNDCLENQRKNIFTKSEDIKRRNKKEFLKIFREKKI